MKGSRYLLVAVAIAATSISCCSGAEDVLDKGNSLMRTNIAIVGADEANMETRSRDAVMVNPLNLIDQASSIDLGDIQEDENDRFITSTSGKLRPIYNYNTGDEENWADEAPVGTLARVLLRNKRCGGGDDDDDDGDANRSRRSRRTKRRRVKKVKKAKKNKGTTTTVTRKVIQNGNVVSQTTETQQNVVTATPVVHTITSQRVVQVHAQPGAQVPTAVLTQPEVVQPALIQQQTVPAQTVVQAV